ncbi:MAG: immunoglobulin domain-containing protein [Phycisphaerales bacterium]
MLYSPKVATLSVLALCAACGSALGAPLSFTGIGALPGTVASRASAISADGQVVGGAAMPVAGNAAAFLFLVPGATQLPIGGGATSVAALSANGLRAVGAAGTRGYIFDQPMGPPVQPYNVSSNIAGVSADGQTTVGFFDGFGAFRVTGGADPVALETLDGFPDMTVTGCSADGLTAIGIAGRLEMGAPGLPDQIFYEAAKYVDGIGWVGLGTLDGTISPTESYANGVSADGTTVVGTSLVQRVIDPDTMDTALFYTAFSHTGFAMTPLLSLAGELGFSEALDASADGSIVVGSGDGGSSETGSSATIWIGGAPQDVKDMLVAVLTAAGRSTASLDNWSLTSCTAISDDGAWLAGEGLFMGVAQGWVAHRVEEPNFTVNLPASVSAILGGTAVFFVEAAGTPAPTVQWFTGTPGSGTPLSDGGGISGAGTGLLFVSGVQLSDSGTTYYCVATSSLGTVTSNVATLQVNVPPVFTSGLPPTTSGVAGSDLSLSLSASGVPAPTFQWFTGTPGSGTPISDLAGSVSGAATSTLTLINLQASAAGDYYCVATNAVASATSNVTNVQIIVPPSITMNPPAKVIVRSGEDAQFAISASGSPAPMYQWSKGEPGSGTNLMDDGDTINGAMTPVLQLTGVTPDSAGLYYCTAFIHAGFFANSTATVLVVNTGPIITQQPGSADVPLGDAATFTVAIDETELGTDDVTYEWQRDGVAIDLMADPRFSVDNTSGNFPNSTLTITDLAEADAGVYSVLITGISGTSLSDEATLTVAADIPAEITGQPAPLQRQSAGETATFSVTAIGSPAPTYQWFAGPPGSGTPLSDGPTPWGSTISGANTNELTITGIAENIRPNAPTREIAQLPGVPAAGSPRGFFLADLNEFVPGPDTLYVLNDGADGEDAGLYKYAYDGTVSQWLQTGYTPLGGGPAGGLNGLVAPPDTFVPGSPAGVVMTLTADDGDLLLVAVDAGGYGTGLGGFSIFDGLPAPTDTKLRGTACALVANVAGGPPLLVVLVSRVGDGATPLSDTGSPVSIDVFAFGLGGGSLPLPSSGPGTKLILDGTAADEGQLTVSPDGLFVALAGYNAEVGGSQPLSTTDSATVPRSVVVFSLAGFGSINLSTSLNDFADQGRPRAAVTDDGVNLWLVGSTGGLRYATVGSDSSVPLTAASPTDLRTVGIFGDQIHVSAAADLIAGAARGAGNVPPPGNLRIGSVAPAPPLGSDFGSYYCEVANTLGTDGSDIGVLEDAATPLILQGPQDVTAQDGTAASFTVTLDEDEDGTLATYTWFKDGVPVDFGSDPRITVNPISGTGAMSTLTIDALLESDAAFYAVQVRRSAGGSRTAQVGASLTVSTVNPCPLDYAPDGVVNPDDLGDFITDYFSAPPIPGPDGFAIPCPDNDPPYDVGYKAAYTSDLSGQCFEPNPDNLGDFITDYFLLPEGYACPTAI